MLFFQLCFLCGLRVFCICGVLGMTEEWPLSCEQTIFNFLYENTYISLTSSHSPLEERTLNFIQIVKLMIFLVIFNCELKILSHLWFRIVSFQINIQSKSGLFILSYFLVQNTNFMVSIHFSKIFLPLSGNLGLPMYLHCREGDRSKCSHRWGYMDGKEIDQLEWSQVFSSRVQPLVSCWSCLRYWWCQLFWQVALLAQMLPAAVFSWGRWDGHQLLTDVF